MSMYKERTQKMSIEDITKAISCVNRLGALTDEDLEKRGLLREEPQQINHFLNAVLRGQSNLLSEQATTLLRVTPLLLKNGSATVHRILLYATQKVIDSFANATKSSDKIRLGKVLKMSGLVCVDPHLKPVGLDIQQRKRELEMFRPFIGERREYQEALKRFSVAHKVVGFSGTWCNFGEAPFAYSIKSKMSYLRGMSRE